MPSEQLNGRPVVRINNDGVLPNFLQANRLENAVPSNSRLKIFSGTANPTLSQVNTFTLLGIFSTTRIILFVLSMVVSLRILYTQCLCEAIQPISCHRSVSEFIVINLILY